ncbi:MAG: PKD domain-containing protein [Thermoplasmata archaeon]
MRRTQVSRSTIARVAAVVAVLGLLGSSLVAGIASTEAGAANGAPPALAGSAGSSSSGAPSTAPASSNAPASGPLAVTCNPLYPVFTLLPGGVYPLDPDFYLQAPCHVFGVDEIHGSFDSSVPGSGSRWTLPVTLPAGNGVAETSANLVNGFYVGMVVSGDALSEFNQSYLEVHAVPVPTPLSVLTWNLSVAVLSLRNSSTFSGGGCPAAAENLSWNYSYYCEIDDLSGGSPIGLGTYTGGHALNLTFAGVVGSERGLELWLNSTSLNSTVRVALNTTTTGTYAFEPAYASACADSCYLDWGLAYGLGVGVEVCPLGAGTFTCDTYNGSAWAATPPFEVGIPQFFNGTSGAYSGDYYYLSTSSASGACNTYPPAGAIIAPCFGQYSSGGDGTYPYFSLNGTGLDLGVSYPYTANDLGGAAGQYALTYGARDIVPFVSSHFANSSQDGFLPPSTSLNVSVNLTVLGSVAAGTLDYSVGGGAFQSLPLVRTAGTASLGTWAATVPAGANGRIVFYVNATDRAGASLSLGPSIVQRGPLPTFDVTVIINPATCGAVALRGIDYANASVAPLAPGYYPLSASGCANFSLSSWGTTARLSVAPDTDPTATLGVSGNGTLTANWVYVRPTLVLTLFIQPAGCGVVSIAGTAYGNGSTIELPYALSASLEQNLTCPGEVFSGWHVTGNLSVVGSTITPYTNGTLTATYLTSGSANLVRFVTSPTDCGGVGFDSAAYASGQSIGVAGGTYSIYPAPCAHYGLSSFSVTGGLSLNGTTTITVSGSGTLTETNYHLTEIFVATSPTGCGGITLNGHRYTNGADLVVTNDSSYTVGGFSCNGYYLESLTASGGLVLSGAILSVNASGTLLVVSLPGIPTVFAGILTSPSNCGGLSFGGAIYRDGSSLTLRPGQNGSITPIPCPNYGFVGWQTSGGISIFDDYVWFNDSGAIIATFSPLVTVLIATQPNTCGAVVLAGSNYTNGEAASVVSGLVYPLGAIACIYYSLVDFESSPYIAIQNGTLVPTGPSTVTAIFSPSVYSVRVAVGGTGCGSVQLAGQTPGSAAVRLTKGTYPLTETPCYGSEFSGWSTSDNLTISPGSVLVLGNGTIDAEFSLLAPSAQLFGPSDAAVGQPIELVASVPNPVAPSGYLYVWSFGDGSTATNSSNTTFHTYSASGRYAVTVEVIDPYHRAANASLNVSVSAPSAADLIGTIGTGLLAAGIAAIAIAAIVIYSRRAARPRGGRPPDE